jgi:chaperonin GroEL (HSP60 family)
MGFLDYSNRNHCNIIPQEEFEGLINEVFGVIADNLSKSLGPLGSSATILDGSMTEATKDGHAILMKYRFHNRYKRMIYNLIKAPCIRMNNTVGDGTTTSIVLTSALFKKYNGTDTVPGRKNVLNTLYRLPRQFTKAWDEVIDELKSRVISAATPIDANDYDAIYNIAYVTSNGNDEISKAIAETYQSAKSPSIKQKDSPTNKSYISPINGFDFPANLISDAFVRNQDLSASEKDICVMIFDHKIETDMFQKVIAPINDVIRAMGHKLLILAPYYDAYMCDTVVDQYLTYEMRNKGGINLIMGQYAIGKLEPNQLIDLATILRAKVITQEMYEGMANVITTGNIDSIVDDMMNNETYEFYRLIGTAAEALLSCNTGSIFRVENIEEDEKYQDALRRARKDLEDIIAKTDFEKQSYSAKVYEANARVLQLEMKNFIYYIGADSDLQKQIIWDSVEDVIKCVRSAIKFGVVPGCQITIARACIDMINEIIPENIEDRQAYINSLPYDIHLRYEIIDMIYDAVCTVYAYVLHGASGQGMVKLIDRWQYTMNTPEAMNALTAAAIEKGNEIIIRSISENKTFDLETLEFNEGIITSAETDSMVLSVASELIKILISGNQAIFLDTEINESHETTEDIYV